MVRTLTAAMKTALAAESGEAFHLFELNFSGGVQRFTDASNDIVHFGNTWTAIGGHLRFDAVQEVPTLRGQGVRMTLDGVDQTVISALLSENYIGRVARIYRGHIASDGTVIVDPAQIFNGLLNSPFEIREDGDTVTVQTFVVSTLTRLRQTRGIRASVASHQQHFSTDTFFRHMTAISSRKVFWGPRTTDTTPGGDGSVPIDPGREDESQDE